MTATAVNPPDIRRVDGYSHAKMRPGTPVFITGQVAWDVTGAVVGAGDIDVQVEQAWTNMRAVIRECGLVLDDIVKLTTYITDPRFMSSVGAAKQRVFAGLTMPASTLLIVAGLADPLLLVEIEAIAMADLGSLPASHLDDPLE
jgi:enamine deaminase RidA (YjgF/YER057c/UK114 family)